MRLKDVPLSAIYHGPLPRAAQTARLIAACIPGVPVSASDLAGDYLPSDPDPDDLPPSYASFVAGFSAAERAQGPEPAAAGASAPGLWLRFLSGPDIDALGISNADIVAAVEDAVRAHGEGRVVVEPRVHLVPDNNGAGHFNVLRGHLSDPGVSGVKV